MPERADPDVSLVARAREGDPEAFGLLVERYMRRAYAHALAIVGSRDDALDLSQEAFARAFRARRRLDPDRPFYAWVAQILRRLCFNFLRDRATRARAFERAGAWIAEGAGDQETDPAAALERAEVRRRLARAIEALPPHEREVLVLREFEGLSYREIAQALEMPVGTVMSRLYSARHRLAAALEDLR